MTKRHSTVLQNAWSKKKQTLSLKNNSGFRIWKNGAAPSYKMIEAKKPNTVIEKTIPALKTL